MGTCGPINMLHVLSKLFSGQLLGPLLDIESSDADDNFAARFPNICCLCNPAFRMKELHNISMCSKSPTLPPDDR
ncbi:hypothetical protein CISIN_1g037366mg [Citrus sinensis]|uniref:Uncharacterized protein n=1 Tax=Citrus sinensis TaxID=2711 RepID=A0A067GXD2_CITSI|nr:hypothetical protein CISIN_1g037366mg [Citrus sinensis]